MLTGESGSETSSFHSFDDSDGLSSEEEQGAGMASRRARGDRAERDFDTVEDDPGGAEESPQERLREWLAARGEEQLLRATVRELRSSGVEEDEWITALEGMEEDGVLAGFFGQIESVDQAQDEENALPPPQNRQFRMSTLMGSSESDEEVQPEPELSTTSGPAHPRQVINPLRLATHGDEAQRSAKPPETASSLARQSSKWRRRRGAVAGGSKGYHNDVERSQNAIKRIVGLLESDLTENLVTLGILLIILIHEGQQIKKGAESKFGESLKFRCTYALEQHTQAIKQGWLKKQGEMGEKFKQRWFVLIPDVWTYGRSGSEYHRILLFYKSEPKTVEERLSPKGAVALHQEQIRVTLIEGHGGLHDELRLEVVSDVDGFIDAGEMRYNYVFAPADPQEDGDQLSRMSSAPKPLGLRNTRTSAAGNLSPRDNLMDWARVLSDQTTPDVEEIERMMPENPQERAVAETCEKLQCDRASIFLLDDRHDELVLHVGKGADAREIRIPRTAGIAGECLRLNQTLRINDPYNDSRFNQATDKKTGYRTTSILAVPIIDKGTTVGVLQAINKLPPAEGFDEADQRTAVQLAGSEQLARASVAQTETHARLQGKNWKQRQKSGFNVGKFSRFNISTTKKFIFFSVVVTIVQTFAAMKLFMNAERFEPDEVVAFILEGYLQVMNCSDPQTLELYPVYTDCDLLVGDGKNIGKTYKGENRLTRGQMADNFADLAADRRLLDLREGGYVAPLVYPWSESHDRLWGAGMPLDEGPPNILCFTPKGVKNGIVNVLSSEMIVGYFIVGEFYLMGRGIFLFVGGPLASLIAPVRYGHLVFYFINSIQSFILLTILVASWERYETPRHRLPFSDASPAVSRIFTVCQDFWMCVETSVSVFVVLELDDRILPMMREDLKRKCRRSLLKRGIVISAEENQRWAEHAQNTRITAGKEYSLHGFCMAYFFTVLIFSGYETSLFAC